MRIENSKAGIYIKKPDKVDQYLLRIAQRFFETDQEVVANSRESIVEEASRRARTETLLGIKKIVIDETKEYISSELGDAIDSKLGDIIVELKENVQEIKAQQIQSKKFIVKIKEVTNEVFLPSTIKIKNTEDIVFVFINGVNHEDALFDINEQGYVTRINFKEDILYPDDSVIIRAILINPEK